MKDLERLLPAVDQLASATIFDAPRIYADTLLPDHFRLIAARGIGFVQGVRLVLALSSGDVSLKDVIRELISVTNDVYGGQGTVRHEERTHLYKKLTDVLSTIEPILPERGR